MLRSAAPDQVWALQVEKVGEESEGNAPYGPEMIDGRRAPSSIVAPKILQESLDTPPKASTAPR